MQRAGFGAGGGGVGGGGGGSGGGGGGGGGKDGDGLTSAERSAAGAHLKASYKRKPMSGFFAMLFMLQVRVGYHFSPRNFALVKTRFNL
jgi:hypothetical protein